MARPAVPQDRVQSAAFEKLTKPQRLAVRTELLPSCEHPPSKTKTRDALIGHVLDCLEVKPAHRTPAVRETWNRYLDEAIAKVTAPPAPSSNEDEDDEDDEDDGPMKPKKTEKFVPIRTAKRKAEPKAPRDKWDDGFAAIPYPLIDRLLRAIPAVVVKVYAAIERFKGYQTGEAWPGQVKLSILTGLGERAVGKAVATLRKAGMIESRRRWGKSNVYRLVPVTRENFREILAKLELMDPAGTNARKVRERELQSGTAVPNRTDQPRPTVRHRGAA